MKRNNIVTLLGGSGFIGSNVVKEIARTGVKIKVVGHGASSHGELRVCGYVGQVALVDANLLDKKQLEDAIKGSDYVVNLIGILFQKRKKTFQRMHVDFASDVAELCAKHKVQKLVHFSALGVDNAKSSLYAQSKVKGEEVVKNNFAKSTILRPSVVFGPNDSFINLFNWISKISPILPLVGGGYTLFQPVYVGDVAKAVYNILNETSNKHAGKVYEIAGPRAISFKEIITLIMQTTKRRRLLLPIPFCIAKIKAFFLEFMPKPLMTRDQVELLKYDNVTKKNALPSFGIEPAELEVIIKTYLK